VSKKKKEEVNGRLSLRAVANLPCAKQIKNIKNEKWYRLFLGKVTVSFKMNKEKRNTISLIRN